MEKNVGSTDRTVRIIVGVALIALIYFGHLGETADIIAGIAAAYLLVTALVSRCPVLKMAGVSTSVEETPYSSTDDRAGL
jgi:hypothetical protein